MKTVFYPPPPPSAGASLIVNNNSLRKPKFGLRIGSAVALSLISFASLLALGPDAPAADTPLDASPVETVISRDAHSKVIETSRAVLDKDGKLTIRKGRYTVLQTGMNRLVNDEYIESRAVVESYPTGAIANQASHQAIFSQNLLAEGGTVDLLTPDSKRLRAVPVGLGWKNAKTGQFAWIARAKDTEGAIQPPGTVVYENAFDSIRANVVVSYTTAGLEAWVVLKENPALPEGFAPESTLFQVITEFLEVPAAVSEKVIARHTPAAAVAENWVEPELTDVFTDWGAMQLWPGRAFSLAPSGEKTNSFEARVFKQWDRTNGRTLLFESLPYPAIRSELEQLPKQTAQAKPVVRDRFEWAALPVSAEPKGAMKVAAAKPAGPGFAVDWTVVTSQATYTFLSGITYKIQGPVCINQSAQIQSGAILKYTTTSFGGTDGYLDVAGSITGPELYQPCAYFTHIADNSIGEPVWPGTIGNNKYPHALYLWSLPYGATLRRLEIRYAQQGIWGAYLGGTLWVQHCTFKNCSYGLVALYSSVRVMSTLMCSVTVPLVYMDGGSFPDADFSTDCVTIPTITGQPSNATRDVGHLVIFIVSANGYALNYQWYFNNVSIPGATASTLTLPNLQHTHAGQYFVVVANEAGSVKSSKATLAMRGIPLITVQPKDQTVPENSKATFSVEAIGDPPYREENPPDPRIDFQYTWYGPDGLFSVGNSHELVISPVSEDHEGWWYVAVQNGSGTVYSSEFVLTVESVGNRTYSYNADFDEGVLINLNHNVANQLQINSDPTPLPYLNVPCSERGTLARINVNSGAVVGEFRTAPTRDLSPQPSRTAVDRFGNTWVANRRDWLNGDYKASITKIGMVIGGIRCDRQGTYPNYTFIAKRTGEWLRPPFLYNTCPDKDGDGAIQTSYGLGDKRGWPLGQATGEDEAILKYVWIDGKSARTLAVDQTNNVWAGGSGELVVPPLHVLQAVDGESGNILWTANPPLTSGGYVAVFTVDDAGNRLLWTSYPPAAFPDSALVSLNISSKVANYFDPTNNEDGRYGLAVDPNSRAIWASSGEGQRVLRIPVSINDPINRAYSYEGRSPIQLHQGLVVDNHTNVWIAHGRRDDEPDAANTVGHLRADSDTWVGNVNLSASDNIRPGPTGLSIDSNQKVWVANWNRNNAMRIDPNAGPYSGNNNQYRIGQVDLTVDLEEGAKPYAMSDMTGFVTLGVTYPSGSWIFVRDGGVGNRTWNKISWNPISTPTGTGISAEVRAANTIAALPGSQTGLNSFQKATNNVAFNPAVTGRYLEVRVTLWRNPTTSNWPLLDDLTVYPTD